MRFVSNKQWGKIATNTTQYLPISFSNKPLAVSAIEGPGASATSVTTVKTLTKNNIYLINNASGTICTCIILGV